jgi:DNA topoisomerase-1
MKIKVSERELLEAGYRRAYTQVSDGMSEPLVPGTSKLAKLERGQRVKPKRVRTHRQGMTEAGLIAALQKNGIGRPATYSLIIEILIQRRYAENGAGGSLTITPRGRAVLEFLMGMYPKLFSVEFTAKMEEMLDGIAEGRKSYATIIGQLWRMINIK